MVAILDSELALYNNEYNDNKGIQNGKYELF